MSQTIHAFDYLAAPQKYPPVAVCVVFGDEPFLKRLVLKQLRGDVLGQEEEEAPFATFQGKTAEWRDVSDELSTLSLFGGGGPRLALVEEADAFVTQHRGQLEDYVEKPKSSGILVLDVDTWAKNTRLFKAVDRVGLQVECRPPEKSRGKKSQLDTQRLGRWMTDWAKQQHRISLPFEAAQLLLDLVGPELGLLDQGLAKLALFVEPGGKVTPEMVGDIVGGWQTKTIWEMIDAAVDGKADAALLQLDRLLESVDHPLALFGQIAWSLRRYALAGRIYERAWRAKQSVSFSAALQQAGFRDWPRGTLTKAERQLKQMGSRRVGRLYRWLLEADLALKRTHSTPDRGRLVLENLLVRLSKRLAQRPAPTRAAAG